MEKNLEKVFDAFVKNSQVHRAFCFVENSNGSFSWKKNYGNREFGKPFIIASITKMFTAACIFKLVQNKQLSLDDKLNKFLSAEILNGLLIYKGIDYSNQITVQQLILQSTGFSDEFEKETSKTKRLELMKCSTHTFEEEIAESKKLKPRFAPCYNKAFYSNINYDILGRIIEVVSGKLLNDVYNEFIYSPLGLQQTYLYKETMGESPSVYFEGNELFMPKPLEFAYASGGVVSTASELMLFIKAFFRGQLFDTKILDDLKNYRKLQINMGPVRYGAGHMQIALRGLLTAFKNKGELVGHLGSTGSFAFYYPQKDLFFVGDICQMANPALPIRLLIKLVYYLTAK